MIEFISALVVSIGYLFLLYYLEEKRKQLKCRKERQGFINMNPWFLPNYICLGRIVSPWLGLILFYFGWYSFAYCILVAGALSDHLDGWIARGFHCISEEGKSLDPLADKLFYIPLLGFLVWQNLLIGGILGVFIFTEMLSQFIRKFPSILGQKGTAANIIGKVKATIVMIACLVGLVSLQYGWSDVSITITSMGDSIKEITRIINLRFAVNALVFVGCIMSLLSTFFKTRWSERSGLKGG